MIPVVKHTRRNVFLKSLVYGVSGAGKTTLSASAADHPELRDVLFISMEGGMLSVPVHEHIWTIEVRNTPEMSAYNQMDDLFWRIVAKDSKKDPWVKNINTIVVDSGSEFLTYVLESIAAEDSKRKDPNEIYLQDYGRATSSLRRLYRNFRDLPMNVIITALPKTLYDKAQNPIGTVPAFTEKLGNSIMGYMDHVWYLYKREEGTGKDMKETRCLLTRAAGGYAGKTRGQNFSSALGVVVENPTLPAIFEVLKRTEGSLQEA